MERRSGEGGRGEGSGEKGVRGDVGKKKDCWTYPREGPGSGGGGVIFKCINNSASILVVTENTLLRGSERLTRNILI